MLTHEQVWRGIDRLALRNQLSASGLAKKAGLDPTTFNKSKRVTKEQKLRWPSTESLAKILDATHTTLAEFVQLVEGGEPGVTDAEPQRLKFIRMTDLQSAATTDESGFPQGSAWEEIDFSAHRRRQRIYRRARLRCWNADLSHRRYACRLTYQRHPPQ